MTDKTKEFLQKLRDSGNWNDNYDYSKVEYVNTNQKVVVIDKKFNTEHLITPYALLNKTKCSSVNLKDGYLPFEIAKNFVKSLGLKTQQDWKNFYKSELRPHNIPTSPDKIYKDSGWVSLGDWLGTNYVALKNRNYLSFEEAKNVVKILGLTSQTKYHEYLNKTNVNGLPYSPHVMYKNYGWKSWGDFLGYKKDFDEFYDFKEARKIIHNLKLNNTNEFRTYLKSTDYDVKIPKSPNKTYKDSGWVSWVDWLGHGKLSNFDKKFLQFEEAREYVRKLNITRQKEWVEFIKSELRPNNIPSAPDRVYKDSGWVSLGDWLGTNYISCNKRDYLPFEEAREYARSLKLTGEKEWRLFSKSSAKPDEIPASPSQVYKESGWVSWSDWLGHGKLSNFREFLPFEEAREYARTLGLKSYSEWKNIKKPDNIPAMPEKTYKYSGWVSMGDWLGSLGDGHYWNKRYMLDFIKSLEKDLIYMDSVELITIINSNNLAKKIQQIGSLDSLTSSEAGSEERERLIHDILDTLENDESDDDTNNDSILNEPTNLEVDLVEGNVDEITEEEPESLAPLDPIKELHMYDNTMVTASLDDENIDFLLKNQLKKLWNKVLNNQIDVDTLRGETGGERFTIIKDWFFSEYEEVCKIVAPSDYIFQHQPNLMQKLISYRLIKEKKYGNWSGTGAGKTLSAIFAGRLAGAKNTIIICNNATVEGWVESINEYFTNNQIYVKKELEGVNSNYNLVHKHNIKLKENVYNYLVLNYETFQLEDGEYIVSELLKYNQIDYIILDEVQNVKQRDNEESIRRNVVKKLIINSKEDNENLLVMAMSATPIINNLTEPKKLIELLTGESHNELETKENIVNGIEMYKALTRYGLRYKPNYGISVNEEIIESDGSHLFNEIIAIPKGAVSEFEKVLINTKLDSVKDKIKRGTLIYTYYVTELTDIIGKFVKDLGFSIGFYTGDDKSGLEAFKKGKLDVLIGSAPVGTGVDGIQYVCDTLIPIVLPWTSSEYDQLVGRVNRQGSKFDKVNIYIPQVIIPAGEHIWSWDRRRHNIIRFKATLGDLAIDGRVPRNLLPSRERLVFEAQQELAEWVNRLNNGEIITFDREEFKIPLNPNYVNHNLPKYGEFSQMNKRWGVSNSITTNKRLTEDPTEWYQYHTLYREARKTWSEIPYKEIAKQIKRKDYIVGDFGCGENLLKTEIPNKVLSFDHVAIDDSVIACDISKLPLDDESIDVVVFSLSLMGSNYEDYLKEAYRVLRTMQPIMIAETANQWKDNEDEFKRILLEIGFDNLVLRESDKFIYVTAFKM